VDPDFDVIRQEHQQALEALRRLEAGCGADPAAGSVAAAVGAFVDFFGTAIEPHMQREEAAIYPLLDHYLPADVGSANALLREHETLRSLVGFMRQACRRLTAGEFAAAADASTLAQDVALLLREHIRKEDGVINPLLERILRSAHV
jgi:hemerythrin-like domain-containing protein